MALAGRFGLARVREPVGAVLPQRLQQPVAVVVGLVHHERTIDEPQHAIDDVDGAVTGDRFGGGEIERRGEHGEPPERDLLVVGEQIVRPRHRRQQRAVPFLRAARSTGEEPEPFVETAGDLRGRHRPNARRGELDRQRDPVEVPADLHHRRDVAGVDREPVAHRRGAFGEQPHRRGRFRFGRRGLRRRGARAIGRGAPVHRRGRAVRGSSPTRARRRSRPAPRRRGRRPRRARARSCPTRSRPAGPPDSRRARRRSWPARGSRRPRS